MDHQVAKVHLFDEAKDIWIALEDRWREIAQAAIAGRGSFTVALSGGRTPLGLYCHLSRAGDLPWERTEIFQVDERFVPDNSGDSNSLMIRTSLLDALPGAGKQAHLVDVGEPTAAAVAEKYEEELRRCLRPVSGGVPCFDLVLLGIGKDGHTASLFPGTEALGERERWVAAVRPASSPHERITLTLPVINAARNVFFLATGAAKAAVISRIRAGRDDALPASLVRPRSGNLAFYLDRSAGSGI